VINDSDDRQVTGIGLATGGFAGGRTAHADHPVAGYATDRIDSHLLGAAVEDDQQVLVFEIGNAIGGDQGFDDLADQHLNALRCSQS